MNWNMKKHELSIDERARILVINNWWMVPEEVEEGNRSNG